MNQPNRTSPVTISIEIAVTLLLIFLIVAWCLQIVAPFVSFIIWGAVIAISVYTPFCKMRDRIGGKLAVTVFTVLGLGLVLIPAWMFAGSLFESAASFYESVNSGAFDVRPPNESVKEWPIIGEKLYSAWAQAAANFEVFLEKYSEQMKSLASFAFGKVAGIGLTVMMFVFATLIAAVMLANDKAVSEAMKRFFRRVMNERGEEMMSLTVATVRSVTVGVLGIAFIQALGTGLGMFLVDVPMAGLWALLVLVMVIAQLPALIVMLPIIIWVFSVESTTVAIVFAIWSVLVSMSDVVLKPMLLGRGVEAPMLVILLGAIGGMVMSGIIGLFVGAVVLALGYKLFMAWMDMGDNPEMETVIPAEEQAG
jgi:predicted PurR-regulated permease PerM